MVEEQGTVASAWLVAVPFNPEQKIGNIGSPFGNCESLPKKWWT